MKKKRKAARQRRDRSPSPAPKHGRPARPAPAELSDRPADPEVGTELSGSISVHLRGFGFLTAANGGPDLFVPPGMTGGALSGDRVRAVRIPDPRGRGPCARVLMIETERQATFMGELRRGGEGRTGWWMCPLDRGLPEAVPVRTPRFVDTPETIPVPGVWVTARLVRRDGQEPVAELIRPQPDAASSMERLLDAVTVEYRLEPAYTAAENEAALRLQPLATAERLELPELTVVAIDPVDAKDHDDALSLEPGPVPGLVRVGVHIADVAAFVQPGSPLDETAATRCFTAYLPGRTLPMLPPGIAGDRCSLVEGEPRLAHSVFLDVEAKTGVVVAVTRRHTRIRVARLLTFGEVRTALTTDETPASWSAEVTRVVLALGKTAKAMRRRRAATEAFISLDLPEVRLRCAENPPRILDLVREEADMAHALVEEFMLAANSAVAAELEARDIPGLFRVHAEPGQVELAEFRRWARDQFGFATGTLEDRSAVNRFLTKLHEQRAADLIAGEFLRTLPRAAYAAEARLHFGLGKTSYCHFTSPIRRYADLVVHQQLWAADHGAPGRRQETMAELARQVTDRERLTDGAYFAARDRLKLLWLGEQSAREPGRLLEGLVAETVRDGCRVYLPDWGLTGFLERRPAARSGNRDKSHQPVGKSHNNGDIILTLTRRADPVRGILELELPKPRLRRRHGPAEDG